MDTTRNKQRINKGNNMSKLTKYELKKQLSGLGIKVEGNYVRKSDNCRRWGRK